MMKLKTGVKLNGLKPEALVGVMVAESCYRRRLLPFTLTSVCDGEHGRGSLHYAGLAFDCRTRDVPEAQLEALYSEICDALGPEFDCILELPHIHIEYQPK